MPAHSLSSSTNFNTTMADIASALTQSVSKDGQTAATADIPMGTFKHTNVGAATLRTQYARADQVQDGVFSWGGTAGGTANAHTISLSPAIAVYTTGMRIIYLAPAFANTAATTLAVNGLTAQTIKTIDGFDLAPLDIPISSIVDVIYDGTNFRVTRPLPSRPNLIINGGMRFDQRNSGGAVTPAASTYTLDRWRLNIDAASKITVQQITAGAAVGASHALKLLVASAYSAGAAEQFTLKQYIEGSDTRSLGFGASGAVALAISFDFWSTMTGTYCVTLVNSAADRSYVTTFSVGSASTWQRVALVIPGDTSGTWLTGPGQIGIAVFIDLGSGSNFQATAGAWNASQKTRTSGSVNWIGTLNAEIRMTRVKAELASPTMYQEDMEGIISMRCSRFRQQVRATWAGEVVASRVYSVCVTFPVPMCKTPTFTYSETSPTGFPSGNPSTDTPNAYFCEFYKTSSVGASGGGIYKYTVTCDAEL